MLPGRAADHSLASNAAVMEEKSYTSTHLLGHTGHITGTFYLYLFISPAFLTAPMRNKCVGKRKHRGSFRSQSALIVSKT